MNVVSTRRPFTSRYSRPNSVSTNDCFRVQQENLSIALSVCDYLKISHEGIATGFFWPCRMESFVSTSHCEEASADRQAIKVIMDDEISS